MPIWKLTLIDKKSDEPDFVIVRAGDALGALKIAGLKVLEPQKRVSTIQKTHHSPWGDKNLVSCQRLENPKCEENGPDEVLYPDKFCD